MFLTFFFVLVFLLFFRIGLCFLNFMLKIVFLFFTINENTDLGNFVVFIKISSHGNVKSMIYVICLTMKMPCHDNVMSWQ